MGRGIVPVVRLLKTLRHFESLHLLVGAFKEAGKALPVLLFVWFSDFYLGDFRHTLVFFCFFRPPEVKIIFKK